jgi:hypothetical protein
MMGLRDQLRCSTVTSTNRRVPYPVAFECKASPESPLRRRYDIRSVSRKTRVPNLVRGISINMYGYFCSLQEPM